MEDIIERNLVNLNLSDGPNGTVNFQMNYSEDIDRQSPSFLMSVNILRYLESHAISKSFEKVDGKYTEPNTVPAETL